MVRAALYARVSTEEQATEGASIPAQLKLLREYAGKHEMDLVAKFVDEGVSARTADRPQFQQMIATARQRPAPFAVILIHKTDRFARNREDAIVYKSLLRRDCGVEVISITEQFEDSPTGKLLEGIMEVMAEFYSLNLSQEVKKGMQEKASQGKGLGLAPLGYRIAADGKYVIVAEEAAIVRWIFATYVDGNEGLLGLARRLAIEGHTRFGPAATRFRWSAAGIRNIIINPAYTGALVWNRRDSSRNGRVRPASEWIVTENAHDPIIDSEAFSLANQILKGRRGVRAPGEDYVLRGLVKCLDCGASMAYYRMQWQRRNGESVCKPQLSCVRYHHSRRCYFNHKAIKDVEDALMEYLAGIISGRVDLTAIEVTSAELDQYWQEKQVLERQLEVTSRKLVRQLEAFEAGAIDLATLKAARERVEAERVDFSRRLADLEERHGKTCSARRQDLSARTGTILATATDPNLPPRERRTALKTVIDHLAYSRRTDTLRIVMRL